MATSIPPGTLDLLIEQGALYPALERLKEELSHGNQLTEGMTLALGVEA